MSEYKACGKQLAVPPLQRGITWEKWILTAPVASQADVNAWMKKLGTVESKPKTGASKKAKSGALPGNTEWL